MSQEEYADAAARQEMEQLKQLMSQQAEAMKWFESQSQQYVTQQHDEWTQKQHAQFQNRDDVTIANLQNACLKLVVLAGARARELQVANK